MKKLIVFTLSIVISVSTFSQNLTALNAFKYFDIETFTNNNNPDAYGIKAEANRVLSSKGLFNFENSRNISDICQVATIQFFVATPPNWLNCGKLGIRILSCDSSIIYESRQSTPSVVCSSPYNECYYRWGTAVNNHFKYFKHSYSPSLNHYKLNLPEVENTNETEDSFVKYLDNNSTDDIEGIYQNLKPTANENHYKIGIKKIF